MEKAIAYEPMEDQPDALEGSPDALEDEQGALVAESSAAGSAIIADSEIAEAEADAADRHLDAGPAVAATGAMTQTRRRGVLSMVGTPIGNLSDASPRVIDTLGSADILLCEDTRVTGKLLARFGIRVPLLRADENVLANRVPQVLERLAAGERVAFVSDAGMPGVSDPGQRLVDAALDAGLSVEVVPGPSAVTCAVALSGLAADHFFFEGFLPRKAGAMGERLAELACVPGALVIYESPRRAVTTLRRIAEVMPQRRAALLRELTKLHEECVRDVAPLLAERVARRVEEEGELRGECVIVVEMPSAQELRANAARLATTDEGPQSLEDAITAGLAAGESKTKLAKRLAKAYGMPRTEVYDLILKCAE